MKNELTQTQAPTFVIAIRCNSKIFNPMKNYRINFGLLALCSLPLISCGNSGEDLVNTFDRVLNKAESLDSLINQEIKKVENLDSLLNRETEKIEKLDSLIDRTSSKLDSLAQGKKEILERIIQ